MLVSKSTNIISKHLLIISKYSLKGFALDLSTMWINKLGINSGSPCSTAIFLANSLKLAGRFRLNRGIRDISCMVPSNSQDASIVCPIQCIFRGATQIDIPSKNTRTIPVTIAKMTEKTPTEAVVFAVSASS